MTQEANFSYDVVSSNFWQALFMHKRIAFCLFYAHTQSYIVFRNANLTKEGLMFLSLSE